MTKVKIDFDDRATAHLEKMRVQINEDLKERFLASMGITLNGEEAPDIEKVPDIEKYAGVDGFGDY